MTLALVIENEAQEIKQENILFEVFKKVIKKDLEVTYKCNQINSIFEDFAIHSDFKDELSSFDQFISIISQKSISELEGTPLAKASDQCSEFFFEQVIGLNKKYSFPQLEELAGHFVNYLYEVNCGGGSGNDPVDNLEIFNKYFHYQAGIITSGYADKK
ncbi:hypothetical protein DOM21_14930 [Bacteriovorax stolpii]|uniref:hypothetical protein n=1 Tax=Bacteriovorax stolpii TaxID=960 RepID=UPI0011595522|nr:hypothetical protein [Bacteriovorax stolpii]QDK42721.1 hypothetical protein DOM21_14930 [Bacteriovorax stolpii]